jgi:hypothetical protein
MVYKTYIEKFCTIVSNSKINTGLNPISELVYGRETIVSRALFYFDHKKIKHLIDDGIMSDMSKMTHTLHITNAGSLDFTQVHHCETSSINDNHKIRAASFDLIFFLIPKEWDRGKGFDYTKNYFNANFYTTNPIDPNRLISNDGCNWFQRQNGLNWDEDGIYSNDTLSLEYDKWASGDTNSKIIGRQHFDLGNESIELDVTDIVNRFINGELENYGIGVAFSPLLEITDSLYENYIGLLTDKTNTFFEPYVETRYTDCISDDRSNFVLNKNNKLYLYCTIGEHLDDLDELPIVSIKNGDEETVIDNLQASKFSKGVYYIDLKLSSSEYEADTMLYDTWSNIYYQGEKLDDVELDFTLKKTSNYFNIGNSLETTNVSYSPSISGIQEKEQINRGDIRKLIISATPTYSQNTTQLLDCIDIRLYVKDGTSEIDVIEWDSINKSFSENYYIIDTNILIPNRYFVDLRIRYGMNSIVHHDVLSFDIVSNLNNKYV